MIRIISRYLLVLITLFSFSCSKNPTEEDNKTEDNNTLTDIDGNIYKTIQIGDQIWMAENLKVTRYRSGAAIEEVTDNTEWAILSSGAYCALNNDTSNIETYGLLYNWYIVDDSRNISPLGWHVPTDEEWKELEMYLGMSQSVADSGGYRGTDEGDKLKAPNGWALNGNGSNTSGFSALPGGYRYGESGVFIALGSYGAWWTETGYCRVLSHGSPTVNRSTCDIRDGFSIRCIKDR